MSLAPPCWPRTRDTSWWNRGWRSTTCRSRSCRRRSTSKSTSLETMSFPNTINWAQFRISYFSPELLILKLGQTWCVDTLKIVFIYLKNSHFPDLFTIKALFEKAWEMMVFFRPWSSASSSPGPSRSLPSRPWGETCATSHGPEIQEIEIRWNTNSISSISIYFFYLWHILLAMALNLVSSFSLNQINDWIGLTYSMNMFFPVSAASMRPNGLR